MVKKRQSVFLCVAIGVLLIASNISAQSAKETKTNNELLIIPPERLSLLVDNLTTGLKKVERVRVFYQGEEITYPISSADIKVVNVLFDAISSGVVVNGVIGDKAVVEDIRTLELDGQAFVVRDLYLDGEASEFIGRAIPIMLTSNASTSIPQEPLINAVAAPTISSISGISNFSAGITNGLVSMDCGRNYNGSRVINDQTGTYPWTIIGNGFGTQQGQIIIAGRQAAISSWSNTKIVIDPTLPTNSYPACAVLALRTSDGRILNSGVNVVPAIRSRIYGQCTYLVAKTRLNLGLQPSPTAYGGYQTITGSYVPKVGDQLEWQARHTAIVTAVSNTGTINGTTTWRVTISEQNADCNNSFNVYTSEFKTKLVGGSSQIVQYMRSSVNNFGEARTYFR